MSELKHDWTLAEINQLFDLPFNDLLFKAPQNTGKIAKNIIIKSTYE